MTRALMQIPAALAAVLALSVANVSAQETAADPGESAAEATDAGAPEEPTGAAAPVEPAAAAPAPAESPETVATIPVEDEPDAASGAALYPYTFAAARIIRAELDDDVLDGFGLDGSYLLLPSIYGVGAIFMGETDQDPRATEVTRFELGAGYRQALVRGMELNLGLRLLQQESKPDAATARTDLGYRFDAGVRATLLPRVEAGAALWYVDAAGTSHGFLAGSALYELSPRLGLGAEAVVGTNSTSYSALARWVF